MNYRNRIVEMKKISVKDLEDHPENWRIHPVEQKEAMETSLNHVGVTAPIIVRPFKEGYQVIDGHMRISMFKDNDTVPCIVVDLDDNETRHALASYDGIAGLAITNTDMYSELLENLIEDSDQELAVMYNDLMDFYAPTVSQLTMPVSKDKLPLENFNTEQTVSLVKDVHLLSIHIPIGEWPAIKEYLQEQQEDDENLDVTAWKVLKNAAYGN